MLSFGRSWSAARAARAPLARPAGGARRLVFESFAADWPRCRFVYRYGREAIVRHVSLPDTPEAAFRAADPEVLRRLLGHVGLALVPHLFALDDFTHLRVEPLALSPKGVDFFQALLRHGLAELRFRNGLPLASEVAIEADEEPPGRAAVTPPGAGALLLDGGGKDSAVGGEALAAAAVPFTWLAIDPLPPMRALAAASGRPELLSIRTGGSRLRARRRYHGHRPYSSVLAFLGLLAAYLHRRRYLVASNERSASSPTLVHEGVEINHQYTKSLDFETRCKEYVEGELLAGVTYFSVLRPLGELAIGRLFAGLPRYHTACVSCNRGLARQRWCLGCPKCAFAFLLLAAFLPSEAVRRIFGADPEASPALRRWVGELAREERRPFDCVGTQGESRLALFLACRNGAGALARREGWEVPDEAEAAALAAAHLAAPQGPHHLPPELAPAVLEFLSGPGGDELRPYPARLQEGTNLN